MKLAQRMIATLGCSAVFVGAVAFSADKKGDAKKGQEVFENSACMGCHNTDTDEKRGNAPSLKGLFKKDGQTEAKVIDKVNKGGNGMPPYEEQLEPAQKTDLVAYLKTL
ncbi:MAG TPA: cytochrome c [Bryobacteraceae bacterium]|nr:cytochrome c [Bryobacteraceae bacterium]